LLLEHEILGDHRAHATGATQLRDRDGEVEQGEQQVLHASVSVGQTPRPRNIAQSGNQHENWQFETHRLIPIGERHFRRAVAEYVEHYHGERDHQGLGNRLISCPPVVRMTNRVRRRPRLGGLLNFYERAA